MLRAQNGELPTHLDEIKRFVVRLLFQTKPPAIKRSAASNMLARRLRLGWSRTGNVRRSEGNASQRCCNRVAELSLMQRDQVNSGTAVLPIYSSRRVAGWLRFFTLIQCFCRPPR